MNKEFVTYKQALALKELGFDEPCFANYTVIPEDGIDWFTIPEQGITDKTNFGSSKNYNSKSFEEEGIISAPTFSQAFRWFREKGYHSAILPKITPSNTIVYYIYEGKPKKDWNNCFKTYEEAESACLDKLIKIIKNK